MTALQAGLATLPAAAAMILITPAITPIAVRIGTRYAIALGFGLATTGFAALTFTDATWGYAIFVIPLIGIAAGFGLANGPASSSPPRHQSHPLPTTKSGKPPESRTWPATSADHWP